MKRKENQLYLFIRHFQFLEHGNELHDSALVSFYEHANAHVDQVLADNLLVSGTERDCHRLKQQWKWIPQENKHREQTKKNTHTHTQKKRNGKRSQLFFTDTSKHNIMINRKRKITGSEQLEDHQHKLIHIFLTFCGGYNLDRMVPI